MAKTLALPVVNLTACDLPDNVRTIHAEFLAACGRAGELGAQLDRFGWNDERRGKVAEEHEAALAEVAEAHARLSNATIVHGRAVADFAAVQFAAHVEQARTLLQQAEKELLAASGSARLAATAAARVGRPVLIAEGTAADRSDGHRESMFAVSEVRALLGKLPEGL